jgi:thiol-disulfide isomerase/thioredoxin
VQTLTDALVVDLGFLVAAAVAIWAGAGPRREVGRAFDLACCAVLPLIFVDLAASVVVHAAQLDVPHSVMWVLSAIAYAWTAALTVLAIVEARRASTTTARTHATTTARTHAGWAFVALALVGIATQIIWLAAHGDRIRPMQHGDPAPPLALPRVVEHGALADRVSLAPGKVIVLDFWATWCGPCLKALPRLDAFARRHPEVQVLAIDIDDPAEARALFDERGYTLTLLAGDRETTDRYGVAAIPHTVVIDRAGIVRRVFRGGHVDLERELLLLK